MKNFHHRFQKYTNDFSLKVVRTNNIAEGDNSFALDEIRVLRNHVSHGIFPIIDNPEYLGREDVKTNLLWLLIHACRAGAIYIQTILLHFNHGFHSGDYFVMKDIWDEEGEFFESNCKVELASELHLEGTFSFATPLET